MNLIAEMKKWFYHTMYYGAELENIIEPAHEIMVLIT